MLVSPPDLRPRKKNGLFSTIIPRSGAQDHSQKSMDTVTNARPFPFFKLPAELRNQIYGLVVVTGQTLIIQDMHIQEFKKSQNNNTYQSRSTYLATDHVCGKESSPQSYQSRTVEPCLFQDPKSQPLRTTYTLGTLRSINTTTTTMLSLNKKSREEVASIFYGENTFHFTTMSSLVPFMKDRTAETRKYIQRLWLTLTVDDRDWETIFTEYGRPATWRTAFSSLVKLPHVSIKSLCVQIDDRKAKILIDGLNLRSRSMLWLHKLSKIDNLEMIGLRYDFGEWKRYQHELDLWGSFGPIEEEINTQTEQELWHFLAPKMLKKQADDHSPDALQQRRIWDFSHTRKSRRPPVVHVCTGHSFSSDSDDE